MARDVRMRGFQRRGDLADVVGGAGTNPVAGDLVFLARAFTPLVGDGLLGMGEAGECRIVLAEEICHLGILDPGLGHVWTVAHRRRRGVEGIDETRLALSHRVPVRTATLSAGVESPRREYAITRAGDPVPGLIAQ